MVVTPYIEQSHFKTTTILITIPEDLVEYTSLFSLKKKHYTEKETLKYNIFKIVLY